MKPWHLGNTTVRSAFRLRDGLIALKAYNLEGQIRGQVGDDIFRKCLGKAGIVSLGEDKTSSVGRKWRSAMSQLGFLYPKLPPKLEELQNQLGASDTITKNGHRLIDTDIVSGWQECFLRALAAYYIPSCIETKPECPSFSPLRHILRVMLELEKQSGESSLKFLEMAVILQCTTSVNSPESVAVKILQFREQPKSCNRLTADCRKSPIIVEYSIS